MNNIDIWRTAALLIKQDGDDAELTAAQRSDTLFDQGDSAGSSAWLRVWKAIEDLRRHAPRAGEPIN